jgi:hypothetical protein
MTKKELANLLNGRRYGEEITKAESEQAAQAGLVVVFGASDDLMEFWGAIYDEAGCYKGGTIYISPDGELKQKPGKGRRSITAIWCEEGTGFSFTYETLIPHETFIIFEDEITYCRGIVFDISDLK